MSDPSPPPAEDDRGAGSPDGRAAAAAALRAAFTRLAPQGSDAWNFLAAFTHLGDRYGPYQPGASDISTLLEGPAPPSGGRLAKRLRRPAPAAGPGPFAAGSAGQTELTQAMGQVVEAFRFLSARVRTLEERLAHQDRPVVGAAWLLPAQELGRWVEPVVAHLVAATPTGPVLHGDCGDGQLLVALTEAGLTARGSEPRGAVALGALERGCAVALVEVDDELADRPAGSLGGLVLSGVVDRLPLHALVALLERARRALSLGAPMVVVASDPERTKNGWGPVAKDILRPRPLQAETWEFLLHRAGFVAIAPLGGGDGADARFALTAATPT